MIFSNICNLLQFKKIKQRNINQEPSDSGWTHRLLHTFYLQNQKNPYAG